MKKGNTLIISELRFCIESTLMHLEFSHRLYRFYFCLDIDECVTSPCLNQGSCFNEFGSYVCECTDGYTGSLCESGMTLNCLNTLSLQSIKTEKNRTLILKFFDLDFTQIV